MNFFVLLMTIILTATAPLTKAEAIAKIEAERRRVAVEQIEEYKNEYIQEQERLAKEEENRKAEEARRNEQRRNNQVAETTAIETSQVESEPSAVAEEVETETQESTSEELRLLANMNVTFYCGCSQHCGNSLGAAGWGLEAFRSVALPRGMVAFGTMVYISGTPGGSYDGWYECRDISPSGIIDIFVGTDHTVIPSWGSCRVQVYVR